MNITHELFEVDSGLVIESGFVYADFVDLTSKIDDLILYIRSNPEELSEDVFITNSLIMAAIIEKMNNNVSEDLIDAAFVFKGLIESLDVEFRRYFESKLIRDLEEEYEKFERLILQQEGVPIDLKQARIALQDVSTKYYECIAKSKEKINIQQQFIGLLNRSIFSASTSEDIREELIQQYSNLTSYAEPATSELNRILDEYLNNKNKENYFLRLFGGQYAFRYKIEAVNALKSFLEEDYKDLTPHIDVLCNGKLGEALRQFIQDGQDISLQARALLPEFVVLSQESLVKDFLVCLNSRVYPRNEP